MFFILLISFLYFIGFLIYSYICAELDKKKARNVRAFKFGFLGKF